MNQECDIKSSLEECGTVSIQQQALHRQTSYQLGKPSLTFRLRQCCFSSSSASCPQDQRSTSQGWLRETALECQQKAHLTHLKMISDTTSSTYKEWQSTQRVFTATATCQAHIQHVIAVMHDAMLTRTYTMQEQQFSNQHVDVLLV